MSFWEGSTNTLHVNRVAFGKVLIIFMTYRVHRMEQCGVKECVFILPHSMVRADALSGFRVLWFADWAPNYCHSSGKDNGRFSTSLISKEWPLNYWSQWRFRTGLCVHSIHHSQRKGCGLRAWADVELYGRLPGDIKLLSFIIPQFSTSWRGMVSLLAIYLPLDH